MREGDHLEEQNVDERMTLKWIFEECDVGGNRLDRSGSGKGQVAGSCEYDNKLSSCVNSGEFLE
jgi:hypothetical protein